MELQELVDRIQRWKERTSESDSDYMVAESSENTEGLESEFDTEIETNGAEPKQVETNDVLDFEEMDDLNEVREDVSGIVEVEESDEEE